MKKFLQITLLLVLFLIGFGTKQAKATHLMGMDIQWTAMGNDTFIITVIIYRRCTDGAVGLSIYAPTITSDSCANSYTVNAGNLISHDVDEITPICGNQPKLCPSSGGTGVSTALIPFGVERHIMKYKVYLGGNYANCCWYKIYWEQQARNSNITTGYADADFYSYSWLNRCAQPQDNGPEFRNVPIAIKCAGQDVCLNLGVFDADADSLSYAMAPPLGGNYSSPWSYTYPVTCLAGNTPCATCNPPTGFNLDPLTGDMCFRPMQVQISVMKVMVTEWRKDTAGVYHVIGKTARDMQIAIVANCNNKLPSLSGPFAYEACAGQQICITINTNDQDPLDTTRITWNRGIPNAQWNDNNGTVKHAAGILCWTPSDDDASTLPYYFTATVADDHCPLNGSTTRSYSITVKPTPKNTRTFTKKGCGLWEFAATPISSYFNGAAYKWYIPSLLPAQPVTVYAFTPVTQYQFTQGGKYLVKNTMFFNGCNNTYFDTVYVDTPMRVVCMPDSHICLGKSILVTCDVHNGVMPVRYLWSTGANDTLSSINVTPLTSGYFKVKVTDQDLCTATDSVYIEVKPLPIVSLPPDERLCFGESFDLDAGNPGAFYVWRKDGASLSTSQTVTVTDSAQYTVQVIDTFGCEATDTFNLFVNPQVIVGPLSDVVICYYDTTTLTETGADQYEWKNDKDATTITATSVTVNPTVTTTYFVKGTKTVMGKTCYGYDTLTVNVNALPTITFPNFPKRCINGGYITLNATVKLNGNSIPPTFVTWSSTTQPNAIVLDGVTGAYYFDPMQSPPTGGTYYVIMDAIAPNGCKVKDSTTVTIVAPPVVTAGSNKAFCNNWVGCFALDTMGQPYGGRWYVLDATNAISYPLDSTAVGGGKYSYCFDPVKAGDGPTHQGETYKLIYFYKEFLSPSCSNTDTVDFMVTPIPHADAGVDTAICISSGTLLLTPNLHSSPPDGKWYGPGIISPDSTFFNPDINTTGTSQTYTIYLVVNRIGCSDLDSTTITVHPMPVPTITASSYSVCKKDPPIELTATPGTNGSRYFLDGNEIFSTSIDPAVIDTGTHTVRYSYTNPLTTCSKDTSLTFHVEMPPFVSIDPIGGLCAKKTQDSGVVIHGHTYAPYGFKWINTGGGSLMNSNWTDSVITYVPTLAEIAAQKMSITIESTGSTNCPKASATAEAAIYPTPIVSFSSPKLVGCTPFTTNFVDTPVFRDGATFFWDFGDPSSGALNNDTNRNPTHTFVEPRMYTIYLKVVSKNGCDESFTIPQMIEVYPIPKAEFSFDPHAPDWATVALPKYKFKDLTDNHNLPIKSWDWDFGDGIGTSNVQNPEYLYKIIDPVGDTGWRIVTLKVVSEKGDCFDEIKHPIYIGPDLTVFIPNAFSPDDNGPTPNEKFRVVATGIKTFQIYIYDRWGEKLYYSEDYKNHGWDGSYNGKPAQMDVFIYKVVVTAYDDKKYEYDGTVHLIR